MYKSLRVRSYTLCLEVASFGFNSLKFWDQELRLGVDGLRLGVTS